MKKQKCYMVTFCDLDEGGDNTTLFSTKKKGMDYIKSSINLTEQELKYLKELGFTNYGYRKTVSISEEVIY